MLKEYSGTLGRAFGVGIVCAALFSYFGWPGLAGFAILVLYEVADKLGDIARNRQA